MRTSCDADFEHDRICQGRGCAFSLVVVLGGPERQWPWAGAALSLAARLGSLEAELRQRASRVLKRGNVQICAHARSARRAQPTSASTARRSPLFSPAVKEVRAGAKLPAPDPAAVLGLRGVIETGAETEEDAEILALRNEQLSGIGG